jgi:hypothetical protein
MRKKWRNGGLNEPMTMQQPPPMQVEQITAQDEAHLKLISVLHYVMGGLYLLGIGFLVIHFMIMSMVIRHSETGSHTTTELSTAVVEVTPSFETTGEAASPATSHTTVSVPRRSQPFPREIIPILIAFYVVGGVFLIALCICNIISGLQIRKRKGRIFSFVVAGVNCMQFPFGTALGVFTFIVLSRPSVKTSYAAKLQA